MHDAPERGAGGMEVRRVAIVVLIRRPAVVVRLGLGYMYIGIRTSFGVISTSAVVPIPASSLAPWSERAAEGGGRGRRARAPRSEFALGQRAQEAREEAQEAPQERWREG
eukprot:2070455-Pyramimonas_sp.AAC.1